MGNRSALAFAALAMFAVPVVSQAQDAGSRQTRQNQRPRRESAGARQVRELAPGPEIPAKRVSAPAAQADFPAVAATNDGAVWVAYLEWNRSETDRVVVRRKPPGGDWEAPIELADGCVEHYVPALASRGDRVFAVWTGRNDHSFDLYGAEIAADGTVSPVKQLTGAEQSDFNVRCASDRVGNVTVVWQSFRNGQADVYARRLVGTRWGPETRISQSGANDWEPDLAIDSQGTAWIVWDSYEYGNYDVFVRSFDGRQLSRVISVTTDPSAQFHASVAVDPRDDVWIAWDDAGMNWGKDFSRSSSAVGNRGLHFSRRIGLRVLSKGTLMDPEPDLQAVMTGRLSQFAELPQLAVDGTGTVWIVFRHWAVTRPHEMFYFYATRLGPNGWTTPERFERSSGRNTQHAGITVDDKGTVHVAYASDGRAPGFQAQDDVEALSYVTYHATLPDAEPTGTVPMIPALLPEPIVIRDVRPRHTYSMDDKRFTLLFGDCHRHTDVRGHSAVDASPLDTYRYALDAAQLDFLGLGDHNQVTGGRWPDGLRDYQWWFQQKLVDLFTHEPKFFGIYSHEHSLARPAGHRNILYLKRGAPLRPADRDLTDPPNLENLPPVMWDWLRRNVLSIPGQKVVVVPHTFGAGPLADWNWPNAEFDCLLEIYQGARGSYEAWKLPDSEKRGPTQTPDPGHFARDALEKGNLYGFVSFSDHGSTHNSWAGIWVDDVSREGIFDAMLARRTFGASDEIILRAHVEDAASGAKRHHAMGEEFTAKAQSPPSIHVDIEAPDLILRVDIVKDGKYIYTSYPESRTFQATFTDMEAAPGRCYYYVRAFQRDPENPAGDPEIAWSSPFFVTYE